MIRLIEDVNAYHLLLFGDFTDNEYELVLEMISALEEKLNQAREYLYSKELNSPIDSKETNKRGNPIAKLHKHVEILFRPANFIDPNEGNLRPNIGLIYTRLQTSIEYSNLETVRDRNEKMLNSAKKAFALKGKSRINSIYDYVICFVD